ncbi:hypothetical protein CDAR_403931 [Caerostris darwini]|uniref:Uncharacterized protein n=1 Tax=Caerostris darwini TaxID=1538125 RepID=A0AAV4SW38_9ARAC|nr:hypothetical protein CDAR_403931 [Caerostris darwini]
MGNFQEVLGNGHLKNKVTQQSGTLIIELQLRLMEAVDCVLSWIWLLSKGKLRRVFESELKQLLKRDGFIPTRRNLNHGHDSSEIIKATTFASPMDRKSDTY